MKIDKEINTPTLLILFVIILLLCLFKYWWKRRRIYRYASQLKGPLSFPIIGSLYCLLGGPDVIFDKAMELLKRYDYEPTKFWLGNSLLVFYSRPEDVEILLNNCFGRMWVLDFAIPLLKHGLITSPVDKWKRHRRVINQFFNQQTLNSFVGVYVKHANRLVKALKENCGKGNIDVLDNFCRCTLDIICETSMDVKPTSLKEQNHYLTWAMEAEELMTLRITNLLYFHNFFWNLTSMGRKMKNLAKKTWDFVNKIVEKKRFEKASLSPKNFNNKCLLNGLIDLTDETQKWTNEELMEESQTMVIAGSETTAITLSSVLVMLALYPEVQEKIFKELLDIFGDDHRDPTKDDINRMQYMEQVFKETLRLFPLVSFILRKADEDIQLTSHMVPSGTSIAIPVLSIHRKPDLWPDPLKFDPDRFLPEEVAKRHRYAFLPFGGGPRNCIGWKYALMSMKVILSTVLRQYKVTATDYKSASDIHLRPCSLLIKAAGGYKVTLEQRK